MKSSIDKLASRGFVTSNAEQKHCNATFEQRIALLQSKTPTERTIGARLLASQANLNAIDFLIEALVTEKKLYPKIEICNSLVTYGSKAVAPLIALLGKIGNNQHKTVPEKDFGKDSYPLPRDIASRTLIRFGTAALPYLLEVLKTDDLKKLSEAIDAIGFICFYNYRANVFEMLRDCFNSNNGNNLIKRKIIRAMSAFCESESFLNEQLQVCNELLKVEIRRSLILIKKRAKV